MADEGSVLLVTSPDFSSPQAYRERGTADLTDALVGQLEQLSTAREAGVDAEPVRATGTIAIQSAALDAPGQRGEARGGHRAGRAPHDE